MRGELQLQHHLMPSLTPLAPAPQVQHNLKLARSLDASEGRSSALEADVVALRQALLDCQARHAEQLAR